MRIQRPNNKDWKPPKNSVDVGCGTAWESPFFMYHHDGRGYSVQVKDWSNRPLVEILKNNTQNFYVNDKEAQQDAVKCYAEYLLPYTHKEGGLMEFYKSLAEVERIEKELRGKTLICCCAPEDICHADFLHEVANSTSSLNV